MKVMTVVGTRPELIKLSCVISLLEKHLDHVLVHTGQNYAYELNEVFYQDLGLKKPSYFLNVAAETAIKTVAQVMSSVEDVLLQEKPDALLLLGDTNSCLAAYVAKRHQVPVFHMEAGNRCFDERVPEEVNRRLIDHISDVNLVYTEHARRYLLAEGCPGERVMKTGSPMKEIYAAHMDKISASDVLQRLALTAGKYFVVSIHREENVDYQVNFNQLISTLEQIAQAISVSSDCFDTSPDSETFRGA